MPPEDFGDGTEGEHVDSYWEEGYGQEGGRLPGSLEDSGLDKAGVLEALLFVSAEPLPAAQLSEITGFEPGAVREILNKMVDTYEQRGGGIVLREVAGGFGFYSHADAAPFIARMIKSRVNPRLSRAALETIAIVAYLQPVSRGVVAEIRGIQSEGVMKTLEERGFVKVVGKGGPPGYPALYGTTGRFLERFGMKSLDELPDLERFAPDEETIQRIRGSLAWEMEFGNEDVGSKEAGEGSKDPGSGADSIQESGRETDS